MNFLANGLLVVRKPLACFKEIQGRGRVYYSACVGSTHYQGVERLQWESISNLFINDRLSSSEIDLYGKINFGTTHGLKIVTSLEDAYRILLLSNIGNEDNEIIAIFSNRLSNIYEPQEFNICGDYMGIDPWCDGYGSMLQEGYFKKPELFDEFSKLINSNGLFDSELLAKDYVKSYKLISSNENTLESMNEESIELVKLWRVSKSVGLEK